MKNDLPSIKILGVRVNNASKEDILEFIFKRLQIRNSKFYIVTPNPEMLVYASSSSSFRDILNNAAVSLADGVGLVLAGSVLKKGKIMRLTGTDMTEALCREVSERGLTVGFLGGKAGVAKRTAECLQKKYPKLIVNFVGEEWETAGPASSHPHPTASLRKAKFGRSMVAPRSASPASHIDILFVAFGFPKQEEWIANNLSKIDVSCAMGVGGAFDYISGKVPRAPKVLRSAGLEWAFRLAVQPWRIKRQFALPVFVGKVVIDRLTNSK